MSDTKISMVRPKFRITLSARQTLEVGRLTVIWGQIDHFVFQSVSTLLTCDMAAGVTLMRDLTTGPLVNKLNTSRHRIADKEIQTLTKQFCDDMRPLIERRNHIMHGIWGIHLPGKNPNKGKAACHFLKNPDNPIFPEDVTDVANKAAEQTHAISRIWHHIAGIPFPDGYPALFFGQHEPRPPKGTKLVQLAQRPRDYQSDE